MHPLTLLIVTGMSGAGKSKALSRLEDNGFYCVDNLPQSLLPTFAEKCKAAYPAVTKAAVGIDARGGALGEHGYALVKLLHTLPIEHQILFLDCSNEVLLRRYIETRRRHPLGENGDVLIGIQKERSLMMPLRESAHFVIDTTTLTIPLFHNALDAALHVQHNGKPILHFLSFGYKRGIPIDADIVLDMRFLQNPFYMEKLRDLSGLDEAVRSYVLEDEASAPFFDSVYRMLRTVLPGYFRQGKQRVLVAFGCTGGRHRSVAAAEETARRMAQEYTVYCSHRDLINEKHDLQARFITKESE